MRSSCRRLDVPCLLFVRTLFILLLGLGILCSAAPSHAQFYTISGKVYNDVNDNAILDAGDYSKGVFRVILRTLGGTQLDNSGTTALNGYTFTVPEGTYTVELQLIFGFDHSNAIPGDDAIKISTSKLQVTVGAVEGSSSGNHFLVTSHGMAILTGSVWDDANADGVRQSTEKRLVGVTVQLYDDNGNYLGESISGPVYPGYNFLVPPGTYRVRVVPPAGYYSTAAFRGDEYMPDPYEIRLTMFTPDDYSTMGFLLAKEESEPRVCIGGKVYHDLNGNGDLDAGEPPLPDQAVMLYDSQNNLVATLSTNEFGEYVFTDLAPGTYRVVIVEPEGLVASNAIPGPDAVKIDIKTLEVTASPGDDCSVGNDFLLKRKNDESPFATFTPGGWGSKPRGNNPGMLLATNFTNLFPNGIVIGGGFTLTFEAAVNVQDFLPTGGKPGMLTSSIVNPIGKTSAGVLAGHVLALTLSVAVSEAGIYNSGLADLKALSGPLMGWTVAEILALANEVLGGDSSGLPAGVTISDLNGVLTNINENFVDGKTDKGYLG